MKGSARNQSTLTDTLETYFRLMSLNGAAHAYRQAVERGLLDALSAGARTAAELARECGTSERPTRLLLEVLVPLGVATFDGNRYELTPLARLLLASSYRTLGDPYWEHLPALLSSGTPLVRMDATDESADHYQTQAMALSWMLEPAAEEAARALGFGAGTVGRSILDVGAGAAVWSLTMAARDPSASTTVTALDWPQVLETARAAAERRGLGERLRLLPGSYHDVDLPAHAFDLVLLGNVIHLETPDGNRALFERLRGALAPGGRLVIFDVFAGQPRGDLQRSLYALGLALRTENGRVYSPDELHLLLDDAGYEHPELTPLRVPPWTLGMLTTRPA